MAKGKGLNDITDVSDDGRYAIVTRLVSRGDNNLYLVDLNCGAETLLTPHQGPGSFGWGEFSAGRAAGSMSPPTAAATSPPSGSSS